MRISHFLTTLQNIRKAPDHPKYITFIWILTILHLFKKRDLEITIFYRLILVVKNSIVQPWRGMWSEENIMKNVHPCLVHYVLLGCVILPKVLRNIGTRQFPIPLDPRTSPSEKFQKNFRSTSCTHPLRSNQVFQTGSSDPWSQWHSWNLQIMEINMSLCSKFCTIAPNGTPWAFQLT